VNRNSTHTPVTAQLSRWRHLAGTLAICMAVAGLTLGSVPNAIASAPAPLYAYDALPNPLPPNVVSVGFEATSTSEFGDHVLLAGTDRDLTKVTITMSDWALYADYSSDPRYMGDSSNWTHPITVNIYSTHLGLNGAPDTRLATMKQDVTIPWRPVADPSCPNPTAWRAGDNNCYNGIAFNTTFDMGDQNVTLPDEVIVGVAYNTADYGANPIGVAGPYNSLNVGVSANDDPAAVGRDANNDNVFWNTSHGPFYTDGGAAGVGVFREDSAWAPNGTVALQIRVRSADMSISQSLPASVDATGVTNDVTTTRTLKFNVTASNAGPDEAKSVVVTETFDGANLDTSSALYGIYSEGVCTADQAFGDGGTIALGTVNAGTDVKICISVNVKSSPSDLFGGPRTSSNKVKVSSATFDPTTPRAPSSVTAFPGNESAVVKWSAVDPSNDGGSDLTSYKITVTSDNGGLLDGTSFTRGPTVTQLNIGTDGTPALSNNKHYVFQVQAVNAVGEGLPASSTQITPSQNESAEIFTTGTGANQDQQTGEGVPSSTDKLVAKQSGSTNSTFANGSIGTIEELTGTAFGITPATFCGGQACVAGEVVVTKVSAVASNRYFIDIFVAKGVAVGTGKKLVWFDPTPDGAGQAALGDCPKTIPTTLDACVVKITAQPALNPALLVRISVRGTLNDPATALRK
jgi:hypothetical protein